jgi:hypothetical protein
MGGEKNQREIDELIRLLADFSTRSSARKRLRALGSAAVDALVEALESPSEGVAWSAAVTLGEIGDERAVKALEKALGRECICGVVRESLERITGRAREPVGLDAQTPAPGDVLGDEDLVRALASRDVACARRGSHYVLTVSLPGGRAQRVTMMLSLKDGSGAPLVAFYTECGPAVPERFEWALKANLRIPFGAFAIRESSRGDKLVMVDAYLRESTDARQLSSAVMSLAERADSLERLLTGGDEN